MTDKAKPPVRAYRLTLQLGADSKKDLVSALEHIASQIEQNEMTTGTWGSPSSGCNYELLIEPNQTHEKYFEDLQLYLKEKTNDRA